MPDGVLSESERARLSGWPTEISDGDLVQFFTLTGDDQAWLVETFRGADNVLGAAVQLCCLPWLGWIPDDLTGCPAPALSRLVTALGLPADAARLLAGYGGWQGRTRREHRARVLDRLSWRLADRGDRKQLDQFLVARAMEHDTPRVLLKLAGQWLRAEHRVRPPVDAMLRRVDSAREGARAETFHRLAPIVDEPGRRATLDALLDVDDSLGLTRWRGCAAARPRRHRRSSKSSWRS